MTLKTVRDPTLPSVPPEEERDDFERITRFRKGQLTTFQELQENVYDDLDILKTQVNAKEYASINAAVTSIGSTQTTLLVSNVQLLTASLTIPSTLALKICKGGSIVKASDYTLTINSPFEAGLYQVFSGFNAGDGTLNNTGDVTFGAGSVKEVFSQWWGAVGDGVTDDTVAFQSAIDSAEGIVFVPAGFYKITSLILKPGVILLGSSPHTYSYNNSTRKGSWFYCTGTVNPAITQHAQSRIEGLSFFYPTQNQNGTPVVFPATIQLTAENPPYNSNYAIRNCLFENSYHAINAEISHNCLTVENCFGYPIAYGITIDYSYDVDRLYNIHWNPNYRGESGNIYLWVQDNGIGFQVKRADSMKITNCFAILYNCGIKLLDGADGSATNIVIEKCDADTCIYPFYVSGQARGVKILNCGAAARRYEGTPENQPAIVIENARDIIVDNLRVWGTESYAIVIKASSWRASITGAKIDGGLGIVIDAGARQYIIMGNTLWNGAVITDNGGAVTKIIEHNMVI